jgi:hypothetical protein
MIALGQFHEVTSLIVTVRRQLAWALRSAARGRFFQRTLGSRLAGIQSGALRIWFLINGVVAHARLTLIGVVEVTTMP